MRIDSALLASPTAVAFTPDAAGGTTHIKFTTPLLAEGDRGVSITHLPSSRAAFATLTALREPVGAAMLALNPEKGDNDGGATVCPPTLTL